MKVEADNLEGLPLIS